jgi:hypothetical protein
MAMTIIEQPSIVAGKRPHQAWYSVWLSWFRRKTDVLAHQIGMRCATTKRLCFAKALQIAQPNLIDQKARPAVVAALRRMLGDTGKVETLESGHAARMASVCLRRGEIAFGPAVKRLVETSSLSRKVSLARLWLRRSTETRLLSSHRSCPASGAVPDGGRRTSSLVAALVGLSVFSVLPALSSCASMQENSSPKAASSPRTGVPPRRPVEGSEPQSVELINYWRLGKLGFIDRSGKLVVKPVFDAAGDFAANGLAPVAIQPSAEGELRWEYINAKGDVTIQPRFRNASEFGGNGLAAVMRHDFTLDFIDGKGRFTTFRHFQDLRAGEGQHWASMPVEFSHGLAPAKREGKWGYIDIKGTWVISPRFENARAFSASGLAAIRYDGKWGYIDLKGSVVIRPHFEDAREFVKNGLASVTVDGKCGFINRRGAAVISAQFLKCSSFGANAPANLARVRPDFWNEGLVDTKGNIVLQPVSVDPLQDYQGFSANGLRSYMDESSGKKLWGYIDIHGESVVSPQFLFAGDFARNGLARVTNRELKTGYINSKGVFVISADLDCGYDFAPDGLARVMRNGKWMFIDSRGGVVIESRYHPVTDFSPSGYAQVSDVDTYPSEGPCWGPYKRIDGEFSLGVIRNASLESSGSIRK